VVSGVHRFVAIGPVKQTIIAAVPMEGHAVHILALFVGERREEHRLGPGVEVVFVVIKRQDLDLREESQGSGADIGRADLWVLRSQDGTEVLLNEIALKRRVVGASLPWGRELWLVLRSDCPDRDSVVLVGRNKEGDVTRPRCHHAMIASQSIRSVTPSHF
jgi:hypothetical protein